MGQSRLFCSIALKKLKKIPFLKKFQFFALIYGGYFLDSFFSWNEVLQIIITTLKKNIRATSWKKMGAIAPVVYELWAVKVEKNGDFLHFFYFAQKWSNLWDNLAT